MFLKYSWWDWKGDGWDPFVETLPVVAVRKLKPELWGENLSNLINYIYWNIKDGMAAITN